MKHTLFGAGLVAYLLLVGCGGSTPGNTGGGGSTGSTGPTTGTTSSGTTSGTGGETGSGGTGGTMSGSSGSTGSTGSGGSPSAVTAADLLALTTNCQQLAGTTKFATDEGEPSTIPICTLNGAVWWQADMDVDCDGGSSTICKNDPAYQSMTSTTDTQGNPIDASTLPFFVIPLPSNGFDYAAHGIELGSVGAVIYKGKLQYGIFADEGPPGIIGEASYAMVEALGGNPDPVNGGEDSGATYIVFTGPSGVVSKNEDHAEAVQIGQQRASELVGAN